jgi:hypothetical protein
MRASILSGRFGEILFLCTRVCVVGSRPRSICVLAIGVKPKVCLRQNAAPNPAAAGHPCPSARYVKTEYKYKILNSVFCILYSEYGIQNREFRSGYCMPNTERSDAVSLWLWIYQNIFFNSKTGKPVTCPIYRS